MLSIIKNAEILHTYSESFVVSPKKFAEKVWYFWQRYQTTSMYLWFWVFFTFTASWCNIHSKKYGPYVQLFLIRWINFWLDIVESFCKTFLNWGTVGNPCISCERSPSPSELRWSPSQLSIRLRAKAPQLAHSQYKDYGWFKYLIDSWFINSEIDGH